MVIDKSQYLITAQETLEEFYKEHGKCFFVSVVSIGKPLKIKVLTENGETIMLSGKLASVVFSDIFTCKKCNGMMSAIHDSLYCPKCKHSTK